jgi:hypothetical protein
MYKLYRVEMEDLSEHRKHNYKYVYAESESDAIIQLLDELDLRVSVRGMESHAHKADKAELLDAAVEEREDRAPLRRLRKWL